VEWLDRIILAVILSMSLTALIYLPYYYLANMGILFFGLSVALLEAVVFYMMKRKK